ncbi:DUF6498-containing protein [Kineobactrum sediminis]|nr:DUF6498-containing protein [Kineobactrum sediminis]
MSTTLALPALVAVNLLPLTGVVLLNWSVFDVLLLYWAENLIIGGFNVARLWVLFRRCDDRSVLWLMPFFLLHYGLFTFGHLLALLAFSQLQNGAWGEMSTVFAASFLALAVSHGISFFAYFLGRQEYQHVTHSQLMIAPYQRVMVLHVTILVGGLAVMWLGQPLFALALLVLLKIGIDVTTHVAEHRRLQSPAEAAPEVFRRWNNE